MQSSQPSPTPATMLLSKHLDDPSTAAPTQPSVARIYDYYLGGDHSYSIDRLAAQEVIRNFPDIIPTALENRMFLRKSVRWLAQHGITQFIDMGSGLPTVGSTHETVLQVNPHARILYAEIEESAVREGKTYIGATGADEQVGMIRADALDPSTIIEDAEARRVIDFSKPVAIMMFALVHFWTEEQYAPVLERWKETLVEGSAFVMTHATGDFRDEEELQGIVDVYARTACPFLPRKREEIVPVMEGWDLVGPGIVAPHLWVVGDLEEGEEWPLSRMWYVGVGFLG